MDTKRPLRPLGPNIRQADQGSRQPGRRARGLKRNCRVPPSKRNPESFRFVRLLDCALHVLPPIKLPVVVWHDVGYRSRLPLRDQVTGGSRCAEATARP